MRKFENSKKKAKIKEINKYITLDDEEDRLSLRCKFNFHYFSPQDGGQDFKDWETGEKEELWDRLKTYSEDSLESWKSKKI